MHINNYYNHQILYLMKENKTMIKRSYYFVDILIALHELLTSENNNPEKCRFSKI